MNNTICIGGRKKVFPSEIVLFIADINYSTAYFENGEKVIVATCLKKIEHRFSECSYFFRANRSTLLNLHFAEYTEGQLKLKALQNDTVQVSRRRRPLLLNALEQINLQLSESFYHSNH